MDFPGIGLALKLTAFAVASWILVHLLAILGVFLALAYPLWWLFEPEKTVCFSCRIRDDGEWCPFCREPIDKANGSYPESLTSVIANGFLLLVFSFVSLGLVFVESKVLFKMGFTPTSRTVSFVIPQKGQHQLGEIFPMEIRINGVKGAINAVQADFGFAPGILEIVDISTRDSFADIFIQKEINNKVGVGRLTGGLQNPGFLDDYGVFGTVFFRGMSPGVSEVEFLSSSMVLANDGRGTNVLKDLAIASYLILPESISEAAKERQEVLLQPGVLGERTEETQMIFYDEVKVMGAEVGSEAEANEGFNLFRIFLELLEKLDRAILAFWSWLLPFQENL